MRVTWVHPSWRDLVIDHLSSDAQARDQFLRHCSVHGALLALSSGGGSGGQRQMPLLGGDADWDALADRLYGLAPDLEQAELVGVLDALRVAVGRDDEVSDRAEVDALSHALLARVAKMWDAARAPVALGLLEAWLAVGRRLSPRPEPPRMGVTWAELFPFGPPDFADRASLERFADWLTLAQLLLEYDANLVGGLGFHEQSRQPCQAFLDWLEQGLRRVDARDVDPALRALDAIALLVRPLAAHADDLSRRLVNYAHVFSEPVPEFSWAGPPGTPPRTGRLDVRRVLNDL